MRTPALALNGLAIFINPTGANCMSTDFLIYLGGVALFYFGYALGRAAGRAAEREEAASIAPLPDNRTQDGPPPKNRV